MKTQDVELLEFAEKYLGEHNWSFFKKITKDDFKLFQKFPTLYMETQSFLINLKLFILQDV